MADKLTKDDLHQAQIAERLPGGFAFTVKAATFFPFNISTGHEFARVWYEVVVYHFGQPVLSFDNGAPEYRPYSRKGDNTDITGRVQAADHDIYVGFIGKLAQRRGLGYIPGQLVVTVNSTYHPSPPKKRTRR